jgi:hypothetical protein
MTITRAFYLILGALGFGLLSVNLVGADPADIIFAIMACVTLLLRPNLFIFANLSFWARIATVIFILLYALSCYSGYSPPFVFYFVLALAMCVTVNCG